MRQSANPQITAGRFEQKRGMGVLLTAQLPKRLVTSTFSEKHGSGPGGTPPDHHIGSARKNAFGKNLRRQGVPQIGDQSKEHFRSKKLSGAEPDLVFVMNNFMESHEWMSIRIAVITALPVHQQRPVELELLA